MVSLAAAFACLYSHSRLALAHSLDSPLLLHLQFSGLDTIYSCFDTVDGKVCQAVEVDDPQSNPVCEAVSDISGDVFRSPTDIRSSAQAVVNAMVLLGMMVALRFAVYFALIYKTRL